MMSQHNCPVCGRRYDDHSESQSQRCAEEAAKR